MNYTTNYGLKKPESTDRFLVGTLSDNADTLDGLFGGVRIAVKTRAEYDAMVTHDPNTLYLVNDGNGFVMFLGDIPQTGTEQFSFTETIAGQWVDGSTIYKKTVYVPNFPTTNDSHYYFYPEAGYHFTNLIKVDIMTSYVDSTYNYQWAGYCGNDHRLIETDFNRNSGVIAVNFFNPNPIADAYLTFYYTKEADS